MNALLRPVLLRPVLLRPVLRLQAIYYVITGLWPFVSLRTFEAISGPKRDDWLVKTVGAIVAAIGAVLLRAERRAVGRPVSEDALAMASASAASLAAMDLWYGGRRRISRVYLLDGLAEVFFAIAAAIALRRVGSRRSGLPD